MIDTNIPVNANVFGGSRTRGATAAVRFYSGSPERELMVALANRDTANASCFAWPVANTLQVRCYQGSYPVVFCGHGLFATAAVAARLGITAREIDSGSSRYQSAVDNCGKLWLAAPRLRCRQADFIPESWFDVAPDSAAKVLGDTGYWIFRWPPGSDLAALKPDLRQISRSTRRAIIVTAALGRESVNVGLRYFAPQYGNDEDDVTGSAAVVAGDYWQMPEFRVYQLSAAGGCVDVRVGESRIYVSGEIDFEIPDTLLSA